MRVQGGDLGGQSAFDEELDTVRMKQPSSLTEPEPPMLGATLDLLSASNFFVDQRDDVLSGGGVFVETQIPLSEGDSVFVALSLPGGGEIQAWGRVKWVNQPHALFANSPSGAGVELQLLSDREALLVRSFSTRRLPYRLP